MNVHRLTPKAVAWHRKMAPGRWAGPSLVAAALSLVTSPPAAWARENHRSSANEAGRPEGRGSRGEVVAVEG
jgi:hypothetical protein